MKRRTTLVLFGLLASGFAIAWADEKIEIGQVPAKVMAAAKAKFPHAKIKGAESELEDGKTTYELAIEDGGQQIDLSLSADGAIVSIEKTISENELPSAVRDSLSANYPGAQLKKIEAITEGESTSYEALVVVTSEIKLDPQGKVLEVEQKETSASTD